MLNIDKEAKIIEKKFLRFLISFHPLSTAFTFNDQCNSVPTLLARFFKSTFQVDKRPWKRLNEREVIAGPRQAESAAPACKWRKMETYLLRSDDKSAFAAFTVHRGHRDERSNKRLCWKYGQTGSRDTMNRVPTWIYDDSKRPAIY